jgi:4-hydroxy-4-methyl-2-oxoglutarate aldolase
MPLGRTLTKGNPMPVEIAHPVTQDLPDGLLDRWRRIPVAVAVDLAPECQISPVIRPLRPAGQQPLLCARAVTARCEAPDFGAVLKALDRVGAGEVLVIDAAGHPGNAMIGDILGGHLHSRGAAGIVCDGAIRDTGNLARLENFSVYSRHVNPRGPVGAGNGAVNVTVSIAGRAVGPGDLLLGDDDGLVALTIADLSRLISAAEAKVSLEAEWVTKLRAKVRVEDIFGLD